MNARLQSWMRGACLAWICQLVVVEAAAPEIPSPAVLCQRVRSEHPRLLLDAQGFADLRQRLDSDPYLRRCDAEARQLANQLLTEPVARYEIPDGKRLLATSRKVLDRVYALAMTYRLHGGRQYADRLFQEMVAVAEFPDWNPKHFLDTAEMTHAVAIAYDWLYEDWNDGQRELMANAIVRFGLRPGREVYRKDSGWHRAVHNWNQVCNGGMLTGALAVAELEPELAGEIMQAALKSVPSAMVSYEPDGAWGEGPGYWAYGTSYNVLLLAAAQTGLGTDFDLSSAPGMESTGLFPLYMTGTSGVSFNFEDARASVTQSPCLFWLGRRYQQPAAAWYQVQLGKASAADMVWYQGPGQSPADAGLPLDKHWRGVEVATMRSSWTDPQATFVGIQCGSNRVNHNHLDLGGFVIDALGKRWAEELGSDDYNLPGYFGSQRYDYYRLRAEGHNCVVINPGSGPDQDPRAEGRIVSLRSSDDRAIVVADQTAAYADHVHSATRELQLDRTTGQVTITDALRPRAPLDVWWFWHTVADISLAADGRRAVLRQQDRTASLELVEPAGARWEVRPAAPLPSSPHPEKQAENGRVQKLSLRLATYDPLTIQVRFIPQVATR